MKNSFSVFCLVSSLFGGSAYADGFERISNCVGTDALMEVYAPEQIMYQEGGLAVSLQNKTVDGYYTLDLSSANKGKMLEPVKISLSKDKRSIVVDQYTRGLPKTQILLGGKSTVDFDNRFGTNALCITDR